MKQLIKQLREAEKMATKNWDLPKGTLVDEWYGHLKPLSKTVSVWGGRDGFTEEAEHDAQLIVLMRNNLIPLLDYVESIEDKAQKYDDLCRKHPLMEVKYTEKNPMPNKPEEWWNEAIQPPEDWIGNWWVDPDDLPAIIAEADRRATLRTWEEADKIVRETMDSMELQTNAEFIACDDLAIKLTKAINSRIQQYETHDV